MLTKNETIRNSYHQTKERRKTQTCHVYELKVDLSSLSASCHESLQRLFHEARWFYNAILGSNNIFKFDTKIRQVEVKTPAGFETRDLHLLSSQMKQGLLSRTQGSLRSLSALKKKGKKVGRLKFKPFVSSIPLKQHGNTYVILDSKHIHIQNIEEPLRVHGIEQLQGLELANANLVQRSGDFFLMVTCYRDKQPEPEPPLPVAGIDFNIQAGCQMVLDCGIAIGFEQQPPVRVQKHQKDIARKDRTNQAQGRTKYTQNRSKSQKRLQKEHRKATNLKTNIRRQLMSVLKRTFKILCTQVECFKGWQKLWGKRILGAALAGILKQLNQLPTTRLVARFIPTTSECSSCHCQGERLSLDQKTFVCSNPECGLILNRHVNAALNMIFYSGLERPGESVEQQTAVRHLWERLSKLPHVRVSLLC
jgi:putative transposase